MTDSGRPVTRLQSARLDTDPAVSATDKVAVHAQGDGAVSVPVGSVDPAHPCDVVGDSTDAPTVIEAIQSLGRALSGYATRVATLEERMEGIFSGPLLSLQGASALSTQVEGPTNEASLMPDGPVDGPPGPVQRQRQQVCLSAGESRHVLKPGEFDGSSPWSSFIAQFKVIASTQGWSMASRIAVLVASLRGPALELFARLPEADQTDFDRLVVALESRFGVANQEPWFRSQLRRRRRQAGEPLSLLAHDIERLVSLAYPSATVELRDSLACDHFMDALSDPELHIAVRQGRPATLPQALAGAVEIEAIRHAAGVSVHQATPGVLARQSRGPETSERSGGLSASHETPSGGGESETLRSILNIVRDMQTSLTVSARPSGGHRHPGSGRRAPGPSRPGACWGCGGTGHFLRNCPRDMEESTAVRQSTGPGNGL